MKRLSRKSVANILALGLLGLCTALHAADYPNKPVKLVVPTVPGGATDFTARFLAQRLGPALGQPVVIDNRPGADGNIGVDAVAKSRPDGYSLVMPITSFASNPSIYNNLPFDTVKDFEPVALVSKAPLVLVVTNGLPVKSFQEFIDYAKKNPGKLNYANSGSGTMSNLSAEVFKKMAGANIVPITYKGAGQIMTDLVGGRIQVYFSTIPAAAQLVSAGKLRALGVTSLTRVSDLPDVPSISEAGLTGFDAVGWFGIFAPAGTPAPIVMQLNHEIDKVLALPETKDAFRHEGLLVGGGSPEDTRKYLLGEVAKWKKVVADAGIKGD